MQCYSYQCIELATKSDIEFYLNKGKKWKKLIGVDNDI
jgi:hypothetical protein